MGSDASHVRCGHGERFRVVALTEASTRSTTWVLTRALVARPKELRLRIWKLSSWMLLGIVLAHCAKSKNTLDVSPPLPPAEEPRDDVEGAYVDAGVAPQ